MNERSNIAYQQIPRDPERRYLVLGDLHGRYATMTTLLEKAGYAPDQDILLSVGDLIDRGPRSVETVEFFAAPERYAVRGNHEQMVLDPENWYEVWNYPQNGGPATKRSLRAANRDVHWLRGHVRNFPICLDVGNDDDPLAFRLIHAEQPFDWSESQLRTFLETSTDLEAGEGRLLWGREDIEAAATGITPYRHPQRSSRRCFCGHTPIEKILTAHNTHWIDTFEAGTLSCIDAATLDFWSVPVNDDEFPM